MIPVGTVKTGFKETKSRDWATGWERLQRSRQR